MKGNGKFISYPKYEKIKDNIFTHVDLDDIKYTLEEMYEVLEHSYGRFVCHTKGCLVHNNPPPYKLHNRNEIKNVRCGQCGAYCVFEQEPV